MGKWYVCILIAGMAVLKRSKPKDECEFTAAYGPFSRAEAKKWIAKWNEGRE